MTSALSLVDFEEDIIENYIKEYDKTIMPIPDIEFEPYILLNKVRKHYMEYIIKLLSANYERNLRIPCNSLYRLPSAIWRCAKGIEMSAAQMSIVLQIYRKNILTVVQELKHDTMAGKLNKKLYDCLYKPPQNEKRTQTTGLNSNDCNCQCTCNLRKKVRKTSVGTPNSEQKIVTEKMNFTNEHSNITDEKQWSTHNETDVNKKKSNISNKSSENNSEAQSDDLVLQLQKLFESDGNDDDIFEGVLCDDFPYESSVNCSNHMQTSAEQQDSIVEVQSAQITSLDERLVSLTGLITNPNKTTVENVTPIQKTKKFNTSKWLCEEYFLKLKLLEQLDLIRENSRSRLKEVKLLFLELFGDDDEEELMSPLNETPEFVLSCKERIAPWVVKVLTPYYIKGRIKGKALFKTLSKHLIRLIYQCSQYPEEYEVHSFVSDFLKSHKVIRCEADYKEFRIKNI